MNKLQQRTRKQKKEKGNKNETVVIWRQNTWYIHDGRAKKKEK